MDVATYPEMQRRIEGLVAFAFSAVRWSLVQL